MWRRTQRRKGAKAQSARALGGNGATKPGMEFLASLRLLKRLFGMPDYQAYRDHMGARHPGCPILSEREFFEDYLTARYGSGVSRCC